MLMLTYTVERLNKADERKKIRSVVDRKHKARNSIKIVEEGGDYRETVSNKIIHIIGFVVPIHNMYK